MNAECILRHANHAKISRTRNFARAAPSPESSFIEWEKRADASFTHDILRQIPGEVAMLTITFVPEKPENNSQMQRDGGQEKFTRHLRIVHLQRTARRAVNRLFQNRRMTGLHDLFRFGKMIFADLDAIRDVRGAQKQKSVEPFVVVGARFNLPVPQQCFENATVFEVLKNGDIHPWMMSSRGHDLPVVQLAPGVKDKKHRKKGQS
jgi:hypothetical protein